MSNTVFQSRAFLTLRGWLRVLILAVATLAMAGGAMAAEGEHDEHHKGLTPDAPLIDLGIFKVTNSMIVTWIVAMGIIIFAQYATRKIKDVPDGAQNFW